MQFTTIYILLDAARLQQHMPKAKELNENYSCLYKGRSEENLADVAPYLFTMQKDSEFENWYLQNGWGNAWGVLIQTQSSFEEIYKHFRKFLLIKTEEGKELYFRFYDPRVLRIFLPTCDAQQLKEFFGSVDYFVMEDENPEFALRFQLINNKLQTDRLPKDELWKKINSVTEKNTVTENIIPEKKEDVPSKIDKPKRRWSFLAD